MTNEEHHEAAHLRREVARLNKEIADARKVIAQLEHQCAVLHMINGEPSREFVHPGRVKGLEEMQFVRVHVDTKGSGQ